MSPLDATPALSIERARPADTAPVRCPHFGPCGGCSLLDRPYAEELRLKAEALARALSDRPWLAEAEVLPVLAAREPLFYRTSLKVPFGLHGARTTAGFYRPGTHSIVDLRSCAIQHPALTELLLGARRIADELRVSIYDERTHRGLLRHFLARIGAGTGETLAGFVVRYPGDPATRRMAERLMERFGERGLVGVVENVNRERGSQVLGGSTKLLAGADTLREEADGLVVRTSLTAFVQVHAAQASVLYAEVLRLLEPLAGRAVVDLFAGHGPIALRLARAGARVTAIEKNPHAVREGERATAENGLAERTRFVAGDAGKALRALDPADLHAVVVDPPRRGLGRPIVDTLLALAPPRVVVVSCWPDTLLRDLDRLAAGYRIRTLLPVDLFPRTGHLETIALLERRTGGSDRAAS